MKLPNLAAVLLMFSVTAVAQGQTNSDNIDLGEKVCTFTNLQGRTYESVRLATANLDGIIYRTDAGGGMISFTNLAPELLTAWRIPTNRIGLAWERIVQRQAASENKARLRATQQQQAVARALAAKKIQDAADAKAKAEAEAQLKWQEEHTVIIQQQPGQRLNYQQQRGAYSP